MNKQKKLEVSIATQIAQALHFIDSDTGAVIPSVNFSATYARDQKYQPRKPYWYRRDGNQTCTLAEKIIAKLEAAKESLLFASGMSACTAIIQSLDNNSHVLVPKVMYHGVLQQFKDQKDRRQLEVCFYESGDLKQLAEAIKPNVTKLVWVETPNNPNWEVTDLRAASKITHDAGGKVVSDCTATPPSMTQALDFGVDISFHSATKYLNGHSDVTAGVLSTRKLDEFWEKVAQTRKLHGTVLQSQDAWLLIRGMRTLFLRVSKCSKTAMKIAEHFEHHQYIDSVLYPGLKSHPQHKTAKIQTNNEFGGMLSIIVKGTEKTAIDVARFCEVFYPATSLGGVESLIEHRKTVSGEGFPVNPRLLRLSVGIEDANDLIFDLEQALAKANSI
ncbi:MAG: PLP-dependent aspartate aminotransferase family protein [Pseudomonadota bacterium]|nr:PLP-dependent aspartate aminotransferase family protein [Pseudomonadota bacterium]